MENDNQEQKTQIKTSEIHALEAEVDDLIDAVCSHHEEISNSNFYGSKEEFEEAFNCGVYLNNLLSEKQKLLDILKSNTPEEKILRNVIVGKSDTQIDFDKILNQWVKCIRRYVDFFEGEDLPYWYNERANISVLTGAAWTSGFIALEEYQIDKIAKENDKEIIGRNDLYISDRKNEVCIEAKVIFPKIDNDKSLEDIELSAQKRR